MLYYCNCFLLLGNLYICERDLVNSNRHIVYCTVLLYNRKEYNLMMADIKAETCSG